MIMMVMRMARRRGRNSAARLGADLHCWSVKGRRGGGVGCGCGCGCDCDDDYGDDEGGDN